MKKYVFTFFVLLLAVSNSLAHAIWIETDPLGEVGEEQKIKIHFGEFTYGVIEKVDGEAFAKVKDFSVWVLDVDGNKMKLEVAPKDDHFLASFTPDKEGTYTVILDNDNIDVIDYTKYDFGIFKTHYHSVAKIQVGQKAGQTIADNHEGITVKNVSEEVGKVRLQVLYKDEALSKIEVKVFAPDQWSKTLETNEEGFVAFDLPWETKYMVEITIKEEVPGTYKGVAYEFIWHCVTHYLTQ